MVDCCRKTMNELWCFDCQNVFDAQQGHHCVHGYIIPKTLNGKDAYFSTKVQKNDYKSQLTFPVTEEESRYLISVINELGNADPDVSAQTDIPYLQTKSDIQLFHSSERSVEKMKHQFMLSNSVETCLGDDANRETYVQTKISKHPVPRIGDNLALESNICNSRMLVDNCGTNVIRSEFSKIENSSKLNNENNNRDFMMARTNIDSLILNKTESEYFSKGHQQKSNVKMDNLQSKNIQDLRNKGELNTDIESNIILHNNEMVSKVVHISERSHQFSVSKPNLHDIVQEYDLENKSCPVNIEENSINQQIYSYNKFTLEVKKDSAFNGCFTSHDKEFIFGNQIYEGDEKQVVPIEILNLITTESKRPCYADANAVVLPSCSLDSERTFPICRKEFRNEKILKQHHEIHSGERPFTCHICQLNFNKRCSLNRHEQEIHMKKKTHKCDICGNIFSRKHNLEKHIRIHTGEKPFKCDICGKLFTRKDALRMHIRIHTLEKPYKCDICRRAFTQKTNLNRHVNGYHKGT